MSLLDHRGQTRVTYLNLKNIPLFRLSQLVPCNADSVLSQRMVTS